MAVRYPIARSLGSHLVEGRKAKGFSQREVAKIVQRSPTRVAELESDLLKERSHRDRLALVIDLCDALDLIPMLVPRSRAGEIDRLLGRGTADAPAVPGVTRSFYNEIFVDLGKGEDDEEE
jgi:transcriptional regulator with XRE-family HTH domain